MGALHRQKEWQGLLLACPTTTHGFHAVCPCWLQRHVKCLSFDAVQTIGLDLVEMECLDPFVGTSVGKWELKKPLGVGTFSTVYKATATTDSSEVAVKVIDFYRAATCGAKKFASFRKRIEKEIENLKLLKHPNIIRFIDVVEKDSVIFVVT